MKHPRRTAALVLASATTLAAAHAQTSERQSISTANAQGNDASEYPSLSADGDVVAFHSAANNLVGGDSNAAVDVFARVRSAGTTLRVSVDGSGNQGNGASARPSVSDDGLRIAFQTLATNFGVVDGNAAFDVFVRDRGALTTTCASVNTSSQLGNAFSGFPSLSPDGRWIAFQSDASNLDLLDLDTNLVSDVFLRDTLLATTVRVSIRSPGGFGIEGNGASTLPVVAANGAFVAFASAATNLLVAADANGADDVFLWDSSGAIRRISDVPGGGQSNGASGAPSISSDGRYVAFESLASNLGLTGADANATWDVYVYDDASGTLTLASCDHAQFAAGDADSRSPSISDDGRYVSFASSASDLVWCDTNVVRDVFRRDLTTHFTLRLSVGALAIDGNAFSDLVVPSAISADGHVAAFSSHANNLVSGDSNGFGDVFVRVPDDAVPTAVAYCTSGVTTNGCTPTMSIVGAPSASQRAGCELTATNLEGRRNGIVFYGVSGQNATPWGVGSSSFLCVKSPLQKTGIMFSGGTDGACDGMLSVDWRDFMTCKPWVLGSPPSAGVTVCAQGWFKDPPAVKSTNLTSALQFTVVP